MNLNEALNAALPELPAHMLRKGYPKLDPVIVAREHFEEGQRIIMTLRPGTTSICNFTPEQWDLLQLFDGERSYEDVAQAYTAQSGVQYSAEDIQAFADQVGEADLWYRSPLEKNITLMHKLSEERNARVKRKSKIGDVAHIQFSAWDPDKFLTKVHRKFYWLYGPYFTSFTLALFTFMLYIFISRWGEIGRDTLKYYTFTDKSLADLAEFWLLFLVMGFFHESSHGLTCKHFGGGVHHMGFHLIYLTPAFFVDVTEVWVYGNRWERMATIIAGVWSELVICSLATVVWWATVPGNFAHELAYKVMLIAGVAMMVVNLNPLIKIDGYYFFSELLGIQEIKERSTAYVSGLVKKHVWRLPVQLEYLSPKLRLLFVPYALLSGLYSYLLLYFVVRFARNVFARYSPEWAFVPAALLAYFIFRGRIRTLMRFVQTVWLDKRDQLRAWLNRSRLAVSIPVVAVVLLAPVWRDTVEARLALEPASRSTIRTEVPGIVTAVYADEGQKVSSGETLVALRNLDLESRAARARADSEVAVARSREAQLHYGDFARADQERRQYAMQAAVLSDEVSKLVLKSPLSGVVLTPRLRDRIGSYVSAGTDIAEVADTTQMRARVYIPEFEMRDVRPEAAVSLRFDPRFAPRTATLGTAFPSATGIQAGLIHQQDYKGLQEPRYYVAEIVLPNEDGSLRDGMAGTAKIMVRRRSLGGFILRGIWDFLGRKVW